MKTNNYRVNYGTSSRNVQLKIDEAFAERMIPADDSVRLLDKIAEEMDMSPLMRAYKRTGRRPANTPATMLKIMLYSSMAGIFSSRSIASACVRDINFIWLLNGEAAPSYHAIARFRSERLAECMEELFYELVRRLHDMGEIKYEHLFVDGTKIEANANKYSFVWKKSTAKYEKRLDEKLAAVAPPLAEKYGVISAEPADVLEALKGRMTTPYVSGRGHRKSELQRDIELLRELLARKEKYAKYQSIFRGRSSFSKTDPDATFMKMKEDHMRNAQLKPGYNVQFGVEGEYITGASVSHHRNDTLALIPLLTQMELQLGTTYRDVTADAGYESEENYTWFESSPTECYIKPQNYERSKTKKYINNMALRENMAYDAVKDEYTCQAGRKLTARYTGKRRSESGFEADVTYYECISCEDCPCRSKCTRSPKNRTLQVSKKYVEQRKASLARITSPTGKLLRCNRSIQSEGAFGVIKQNYAFRQFLLRGKRKVFTELLLVAMAYNVNKLHSKIQQNRTGTQLFGKLSA